MNSTGSASQMYFAEKGRKRKGKLVSVRVWHKTLPSLSLFYLAWCQPAARFLLKKIENLTNKMKIVSMPAAWFSSPTPNALLIWITISLTCLPGCLLAWAQASLFAQNLLFACFIVLFEQTKQKVNLYLFFWRCRSFLSFFYFLDQIQKKS